MPVTPTVSISTIFSGGNLLNLSRATAGFSIQGTATGIEIGQAVTINLLNSSGTIVYSGTTLILLGSVWSLPVSSIVARGLADGTYTVQASSVTLAGLSATASAALQVDETAPSITQISTTPGSGTLGVGQVVTFTATTNEAVTLNTTSGTPSLTLNNGATATYVSGSGSNQLLFRYTVAAGQDVSDLAVTNAALNGATMVDAAGNSGTIAGTAINPAGILTIATGAPAVSIVTASPATASIGLGQTVQLTVTMNRAVNVTTTGGTPTLTLNNGGTAIYVSGSGTNQLVFQYVVGSGQDVPDLAVSGVVLHGGVIADLAGNAANMAGATVNPAGTLTIDATPPTIAISPLNNVLNLSNLTSGLTISGATTAENGQIATIRLLNSSGTAVDTYSVAANAGIWSATITPAQALALLNGSYTITANVADLAGNSAAQATLALNVDTTPPTVLGITTNPSSGTLATGATVQFAVAMSKPVTVTANGVLPTLALSNGATATYVSGTGTNLLNFQYTVVAGQNVADLAVNGLSLNGGTITDAVGNAANLASAAVNPAGILAIDTTTPVVLAVTANPASADLKAGQSVVFTANMSGAVMVSTSGGVPKLLLSNGGFATYASGSGTSQLQFTYTVLAGQDIAALAISGVSLNGGSIVNAAGTAAMLSGAVGALGSVVQIDTTPPVIAINPQTTPIGIAALTAGVTISGTSNAENGQVATVQLINQSGTIVENVSATVQNGAWSVQLTRSQGLALANGQYTIAANVSDVAGNLSLAATQPITIDSMAPSVAQVTTNPGTGTLGAGQVVTFAVNFSEPVTVSTTGGVPSLALSSGGTAMYASGSGTNQLLFQYTVVAGQNSGDLAVTGSALNGATITDTAGNAADLTGAAINPVGTLVIDTVQPAVSVVTMSPSNADLGIGQTVLITVNTTEAVSVTANAGQIPSLALNNGGTAAYVSGSGSTQLVFSYSVAAGQDTADLAISSYALNGASIADTAGNVLSLAGVVTNPAGVLQIDATPPSVTINPIGAPVNASAVANGFSISGTTNAENGQTVSLQLLSGTNSLDQYNVAVSNGQWSAQVTPAQAAALANGSYTLQARVSDLAGNASPLASSGFTVATTLPVLHINPIDGDNDISAAELASGLTISGTATGLTTGQSVTLTVINAANATVGSVTAAVTQGNWSGILPASVAQGLADGLYTITASATDTAGNMALQVSQAITLDTVAPSIAISAADPVNLSKLASGFAITGSSNAENWQVAQVSIVNAGGQTVAQFSPDVVGGVWSVWISSAAAAGLSNGNYTVQASVSDLAGNVSTIASQPLLVDGTIPVVNNTVFSRQSGRLDAGNTVNITLDLNKAVTVGHAGGLPTLALSDGGTAVYVSGSGTDQLVFQYTVQAGDNASGISVTGVALGGSAIQDLAGNAANLSAAIGASASMLTIDTTAPSVSLVTAGSTQPAGIGHTVTITVAMTEAVQVGTTGGVPSLALNNGGTATYVSGSGSNQLVFQYVVAAGQDTSALAVTSVALNNATITDGAGNIADLRALTGAVSGAPVIDATLPSMAITNISGQTNGALNAASLHAGFTVSGTTNAANGQVARISLVDSHGAVMRSFTATVFNGAWSVLVNGSQTSGLADGSYTLQANIADTAGNQAPTASSAFVIDTTPPAITIAAITGDNSIDASEAASGFAISGGSTADNGQLTTITITNAQGATVLSQTASVANGTWSTPITAHDISNLQNGTYLVAATVSDEAGNAAVAATQALTINTGGTQPVITPSVLAVVTNPASGTLQYGQIVTLTLTMNEAVNVSTANGVPALTLNNGGIAHYAAGSGTNQLSFQYTIGSGQTAAALAVAGISLNGGTISDAALHAADLTGVVNNLLGTLAIDTAPPAVQSVTASPANGDLSVGGVVDITVSMTKPTYVVDATGNPPTLALNDGGTAIYVSGSGTSQLVFQYTVAAGDNTPDLAVDNISFNGSAVTGPGGIPADFSAVAANPVGILQIDTTAPHIVIAPLSQTINAALARGGVTVAGTSDAEDGQVATIQIVNGSGAVVDSTTASVANGQWSANITPAEAFALAGGIYDLRALVADRAGNAAQAVDTIAVDTTAPVLQIAAIGTGDIVNAAAIANGFPITGSATDLANGATVQLSIMDGGNNTIETVTGTVSNGQWSAVLTPAMTRLLADGTYTLAANAVDHVGNIAQTVTQSFTVDATPPVLAIDNPGVINAAALNTGFAMTGTTSAENGQQVSVQLLDDHGAVVGTYTGAAINGTWRIAVPASGSGQALADGVYTAQASVADLAGNPAQASPIVFTADGNIPIVGAVAITAPSQAVGAGQIVTVTLTLDKTVVVTTTGGTPALVLSNGGVASYVSGSGSNTLVFQYQVASGHDGNSLAISRAALNGGTITDQDGNPLNFAGAIAASPSSVTVDTTAPDVSTIAILSGSRPVGLGDTVTLRMDTSEPVMVNTAHGVPVLLLNNGGSATYMSGSGTNQLVFKYSVASGQDTSNLQVVGASLNNATITDPAGNAIQLGNVAQITSGSAVIDATPPTIAINALTNAVNAADLQNGFAITGTTNAENGQIATVNVTLAATNGSMSESYTVPAINGAWSATITPAQALTLADGTYTLTAEIADLAGNMSLPAVQTITIDATPPAIRSVAANLSNVDLDAGNTVLITLTMTNPTFVAASGTGPALTLNDGGTATYVSGSGTNQLVFSYTVAHGENANNLSVTGAVLNGASMTDLAGNTADLTAAAALFDGITVDTNPPKVISITASDGDTAIGLGQSMMLTVNMSQAVQVTNGTGLTLSLSNGGTASYVSGSGTSQLVFRYVVASGQSTSNLLVSNIGLNGATIADLAGNAAVTTGLVNAPAGGAVIDATPPDIDITAPGGPIDAQDLTTGFTIGGTTTAEDGQTTTVRLILANSNGTAVDSYTAPVSNGAWSVQVTPVQALALANGIYTIEAMVSDQADNQSITASKTVTVDSTTPVATGISVGSQSGNVAASGTVILIVNTSEPVTVDTTNGIPTLTLNDGGVAQYTSGSGSDRLMFAYTVGAGDQTSALAVNGFSANGAVITDSAGNMANLGGVAGQNAGNLSVGATAPSNLTVTDAGMAVNGSLATNTATPTIKGVAIGNSVVQLWSNGVMVGSGTADATTGMFSIVTSALPEGAQTIQATASINGAVSVASPPLAVTIVTTPPPAPTVTLSGTGNDGGVQTVSAQPLVTGIAAAGSQVSIYSGGNLVGTTTANANTGQYAVVTSPLTTGNNVLTATATDAAGNISHISSALDLDVNTSQPVSVGLTNDTGFSDADQLTSNSTLSGVTTPNATVTLLDGSTVIFSTVSNSSGDWTANAQQLALTDGDHTIAVNSSTDAGRGAAQISFDLKTQIGAINARNVVSNTNTSVMTGTAEAGSAINVAVDGTMVGTTLANSAGAWSLSASGINDGLHQITASAHDGAGNIALTQSTLAVVSADNIGTNPYDDVIFYNTVKALEPDMQFLGGSGVVTLSDGVINIGIDTSESYVQRLYETLYGRSGEIYGLSYWQQQLQNSGDVVSIAQGFLNSSENQGYISSLTNDQFVTMLYANALGRTPDSAGGAYWVMQLNNGVSRAQVLSSFAQTDAVKQALQTTTDGLWVPDQDAKMVIFSYIAALGRTPDAGGFNYWLQQLNNGMAVKDFENTFLQTNEVASANAGLTHDQIVTEMYQNAYGRAPSSTELAGAENQTNAAVLTNIVQSSEANAYLQAKL